MYSVYTVILMTAMILPVCTYMFRILVMVGGRASDQMEKLDFFQKATVRYMFHE